MFTEEVNDGPALRRMRQAGIVAVTMQDAEALITNGAASPAAPASGPPVIVSPLETGIVLHDLAGLSVADPNAAAKKARMKELLLISEWFKMPVLAADPQAALAALPADLKAIVKRPFLALSARPAQVKQLVVAGGRSGLDAVTCHCIYARLLCRFSGRLERQTRPSYATYERHQRHQRHYFGRRNAPAFIIVVEFNRHPRRHRRPHRRDQYRGWIFGHKSNVGDV